MVDLTNAPTVIQAIAGGATYGFTFYLRARWDGDDVTDFDAVKFGTTIAIAALLGIGMTVLGIEITFGAISYALVTFAGAVALTEAAVKALVRGDRQHAGVLANKAIDRAIRDLLGQGTSREQISESVERGTRDHENMTDDELRDEWTGPYDSEETFQQVDDEDEDGDGDRDGVMSGGIGSGSDSSSGGMDIISPIGGSGNAGDGDGDNDGQRAEEKDLPPG